MQSNILSICIPTYNRANKLLNSLNLIINKIQHYNIPIFISDNNSNDNTSLVINQLKQTYPYIYYSKNNENFGLDVNIEKALKLSNTKYSWLFGDDDFFEVENIHSLMHELEKDYSLIVLSRYLNKKKTIYKDPNILLSELCSNMTWISTLIIRRDIITSGEFNKFYQSNWCHLGVIFNYFSINETNVLFYPSIIIKELPNNKSYYNKYVFRTLVLDLSKLLIELPKSIYKYSSKKVAIRLHNSEFLDYRRFLIKSRINNEINLIIFFKNFKYLFLAFPLTIFLFIFLLTITPNFLLLRFFKYD
jgi:glycosyltransferase involved in cell wall biosynthesis